jgi:CRISPR/Cas system-associated exonuclease Cas4 (RecB family)
MLLQIEWKEMIKIKITKSMLGTFAFCPYRFYREYILKEKFPPNDAMASGTRMHDFFEWFFDHCFETEPDKWELMIPPEFTPQEAEMCRVFLTKEKERLDGLKSLGCEDEFVPPYREFHVDLPEDELHGYIDRIDHWNKENKEFVIVEYKTGWGHNVQKLKQELSFYKMIFEKAGLGTVPMYLVINPKRRVRQYIPASSRGVTSTKKRVAILRDAIENNTFPMECTDDKKKWCLHCTNPTSDCYEHRI